MILRIFKNSKPFVRCIMVALVVVASAEACPTCKQAVAENGGDTVRGFFWSICFMMSMPFLIFTTVSVLLYNQFRKAGNVNDRYSTQIASKLGVGRSRNPA